MVSKEVKAPWGPDSCVLKEEMAGVQSSQIWELGLPES